MCRRDLMPKMAVTGRCHVNRLEFMGWVPDPRRHAAAVAFCHA